MTRYDPNLMLALLRKGRELSEYPSEKGRAESLDLLSQIANMEGAQESVLSPVEASAASRGGKAGAAQIGKQPVSFTLKDTQGNHLALILETALASDGLRLTGELFAEGTSNWGNFTAVVSQQANIQDYVEVEGTGAFSLLLSQSGLITLKLISSVGEVILLENVEVIAE